VTPLATAIFASATVAAFVLTVLTVAIHEKRRRRVWASVMLAAVISGVLVFFWGVEEDHEPKASDATRSPIAPAPTAPVLSPPYPLADSLSPEPERVSATSAGSRQASVPAYSLTARNCPSPSLSASARLDGRADRVTGSFALNEGTPAETRTLVQIIVGEEKKFEEIVTPNSGRGFDISVSEAELIVIELSTMGSTTNACGKSEYELLIMDAIVR
jgi:hypothetical protein